MKAEGIFSGSSEVFIVDHVVSGSNGVLRFGNAPWLYIMILMMISFAATFYALGLTEGRKRLLQEGKGRIYLCGLLISQGYFLYWITRPEEYSIIAAPLAIIVLLLYEKLSLQKSIYAVIASLVITAGVTAFAGSTLQSVHCIKTKLYKNRIMSVAGIEEDMERFAAVVPKDCYGYTYGIPMIYMCLGWNVRYDRYESADKEDCVISDDPELDQPGLELSDTVTVGTTEYYLYRRIK